MNTVFLSIGTNIGQREENLKRAVKMIEREAGSVKASSSVYETEPWEMAVSNLFLNMVLKIETLLTSHILLETLLDIEDKMGRRRESSEYSSRIIDIDILFFNNLIINNNDLVVPHPFIARRRFVLEPLAEIAPQFIHPVLEKSIELLLELCTDKCVVRKTKIIL
jgi:2-amino-4-hydroxy-6-hydroxymethyldihydropteridine diphosphokinase